MTTNTRKNHYWINLSDQCFGQNGQFYLRLEDNIEILHFQQDKYQVLTQIVVKGETLEVKLS